ncbi:hypothetical protein Ancab_020331 [Ancistrocladus abbreviatus]
MEIDKSERKIVVAVDESEESMYALSWCLNNLVSDQDPNSAVLVLLYVKPPPPVYSTLDVSGFLFGNDVVATIEEHSRGLVDSVFARADSVYRKSNSEIKVEKKVGSGEAKDVICGTVKRLEADILVMGSHGYGFFKRALLGSVSDYCAKHVKCPVVVVKHPNKNEGVAA